MKRTLYSMPLLCLAFGCAQPALTKQESSLLEEIGFDSRTMLEVKSIAGTGFTQYETSDPGWMMKDGKRIKTGIVKQPGITFLVRTREQEHLLGLIANTLDGTGYIAFISEMDFFEEISAITLIKSADPFGILAYEKTDGINYGIEAKDVVERLKLWDNAYGIEILGADYDWVYIRFTDLPPDLPAFADEVYRFCPDSVDQGVGSIEELMKTIRQSRELFLWWD